MSDMPTQEAVLAALKEEPVVENAPKADEPAAAATTAGAVVEPAKNEPAKVAEPAPAATDPVAAYSSLIKEKGARAAFDSLPEEVKVQIAAEMYPGLHRVISKKETERSSADSKLAAIQTNIEKLVNDRFDELMTSGLSEEDKKTYLDKRKAEAEAAAKKETPTLSAEELAARDEAVRKVEYAWSLVEKAGLPRDPNDPRVRALDFGWEETDFGKAMARLQASLNTKTAPVAAVAAAAPAADKEAATNAAKELAAQMVRDELRRLGLLTADTGKPGASGGPLPPKTLKEAHAAARDLLVTATT